MTHRIREMALPALLASGSLLLASVQVGCASQASQPDTQPATEVTSPSSSQAAQAAWSPDELNQLVAPIALYPDALVAQVVAAASYPTQIVEADRWIQQNSGLKGEELAKAADSQSWDPSVKALTQFPSVLATMDKNLSWTSALGEAYVDQPQNVLDAVQVMRQRAQQAGNLKSTPQEAVTTEGQSIVIQPADPDVVYVPEYDPWIVYGDPVEFYPDWAPGAYFEPGIAFGVGVGVFGGFGWGGTTGEPTGTATKWNMTTTTTSRTARLSVTTGPSAITPISITDLRASITDIPADLRAVRRPGLTAEA